jgi:hypothetical protein
MSKKTTPAEGEYILEVRIGAMCDPIAVQLKKQKLKFNAESLSMLQDDVDAYLRLKIRSMLSRAEANKVSKRIYLSIQKHVANHN